MLVVCVLPRPKVGGVTKFSHVKRKKKERGKFPFLFGFPLLPQPLFSPGIIYRPIKTGEGGREALFLVGQETLYYMCRLLGSMTFPLDTHREALIHRFFKKCFFETPCLP